MCNFRDHFLFMYLPYIEWRTLYFSPTVQTFWYVSYLSRQPWTTQNIAPSSFLHYKQRTKRFVYVDISTRLRGRKLGQFLIFTVSNPKNQRMCDPILVTLLKMPPHYSHSSRANATPSSGTSPLASYKEAPPTSPGAGHIGWGPKCSHHCATLSSQTKTVGGLLLYTTTAV